MDNYTLKIVIRKLRSRYSDKLKTELVHKNLTELFVATLLSPQCTDAQVNKTTAILFKRFRTIKDYDNADIKTLQRLIS